MNLKIAVVYNTEPKLCTYIKRRPDIYVPILAGRAWNKKSYDTPGLLYDDVGDNISWLNPYINETTAIYWLGHHLDALGNPDYIGLHHYRRLFNLDVVVPHLAPDTLILNLETVMLPTIDFLELCHGVGRYFGYIAQEALHLEDPEINRLFNEFVFSRTYYSRNLFIVPRHILISLVEFIKLILRHVAKDINYDLLGTPGARSIGFIMERMIGFYFMLLQRRYGYKVYPTMFGYVDEQELK
jgi:hypothetical protein